MTDLNSAHIDNNIVSDSECSSDMGGDPSMLEMIVVKDVSSGAEVRIVLLVMRFFLTTLG